MTINGIKQLYHSTRFRKFLKYFFGLWAAGIAGIFIIILAAKLLSGVGPLGFIVLFGNLIIVWAAYVISYDPF